MPQTLSPTVSPGKPKLLDQVRGVIHRTHDTLRTEQSEAKTKKIWLASSRGNEQDRCTEATNLQVAQLTTLLTDYRQSNKDVATTGAALDAAQRLRKESYDGEDGLRVKMKAIKKSHWRPVRQGPEFASVKDVPIDGLPGIVATGMWLVPIGKREVGTPNA